MKKRVLAVLMCLVMSLTLLPVTVMATETDTVTLTAAPEDTVTVTAAPEDMVTVTAEPEDTVTVTAAPKTYTFTPTESWDGSLRDNLYYKGDTIVFIADENEPFSSNEHGACHSPTVGVSFIDLNLIESGSVTGGICSVNEYSRDGSGCMVSFTITSDDPVSIRYKGAGPTGVQSPPAPHEPGENFYAYRYHHWEFTIVPPPVETVETPIITPVGGDYASVQSVTLSCATADAIIRYTTDGTDPTESSPVYCAAIPVYSTASIRVKAFKDGMTESGVASERYEITAEVESYPVIKGKNSKWTPGSEDGLTVRVKGDYEKFRGVSVDGYPVSSDKYTDKSGSTVVTLKTEYLQTLPAGDHALCIDFEDGYAETAFTVKTSGTASDSQSGDGNMILWIILPIVAAAIVIVAFAYFVNRKRRAAK